MKYLQEFFTLKSRAIHTKQDKISDNSSAAHYCSNEWKDLVGFRDEMRFKRYQTRSNHINGALFNFFIHKEKASQTKELHAQRKDKCTGCLSSSLNIYSSNTLYSREIVNNNRRNSHHVQTKQANR